MLIRLKLAILHLLMVLIQVFLYLIKLLLYHLFFTFKQCVLLLFGHDLQLQRTDLPLEVVELEAVQLERLDGVTKRLVDLGLVI